MFRVIQFSRCKPKTSPVLTNRGGDEGDRTPYPLLARQVLSQMSYTPVFRRVAVWVRRSSLYEIGRSYLILRMNLKIKQ